ncbi:hypothetical protein ACFYO0_11900 [Streptomyces sp. NPDC006365]|uniref:hypothetical protein n=1 Tax=Streptomyces sp. NPDC006365 TaxID=3364744 RepID=UPI003690C6D3
MTAFLYQLPALIGVIVGVLGTLLERTMVWLAGCRRLHGHYERKANHFLAFTSLAP